MAGLGPNGERLLIGNRRLLVEDGISIAGLEALAAQHEEQGHTVVFVSLGTRLSGLVVLRNAIRPGARAAVQRLFDLGLQVYFLSGDHRATADAIAAKLDIEHVKADLSPEEGAREVARLGESGALSAVIGKPSVDGSWLDAAGIAIAVSKRRPQHGQGSPRHSFPCLSDHR